MDGPGTYSQPPYAGGSKDESGTAAKDTISIGSGDRVSGADRMGMEVHPYTSVTEKQKTAMEDAQVDFVSHSIYEITYNCLVRLLAK